MEKLVLKIEVKNKSLLEVYFTVISFSLKQIMSDCKKYFEQ